MQTNDTSYVIETEHARFSIMPATNTWELVDKRAQVTWGNAPNNNPWVEKITGKQRNPLYVSTVERVDATTFGNPKGLIDNTLRCHLQNAAGEDSGLTATFRLLENVLQVYIASGDGTPTPTLALFGAGLEMQAAEAGEALLPIRIGLLLPAAGDAPVDMHLGTYDYEGVHMAMTGLFKSGAALMATWGDPYIKLRVSRKAGCLNMHFELNKTARSLQLHCLGEGDLHNVASAYRERAEALGYRITWNEKLKTRPQAKRLFGACNVKLWHALARRIDENLVEQSVTVRWTFDEVAQVAEHLKHDLELQDVLFHLGGWTRYGYDCKHPDNMPANPECGGNEGLVDCAKRVKACDYLFCLHDNYQDMYRDAPSWDEAWLQKNADGSPTLGGVWLGGRAYYTCAREAVRLAQRPENLPLIHDTFDPDLYFIDTTYAVGPQECYDPRHPLTKQEDIHWKQVLSDYSRDLFGMFGSECGREWAVPHADFFEGLASVRGQYYHRLDPEAINGRVVPFFDMVFRDCIAIHGKYGYKPEEMAEQVIHHVAIGRTLYYHALGEHLYWKDLATHAEAPFPEGSVDMAVFTRAHNGWAEGMNVWDRFIKNTHEVLGPLNKRTSQTLIKQYAFLDEDRLIRKTSFGNGVVTFVNGSSEDTVISSPQWGKIILPPYGFFVEAGDFVAFHAKSWNGHTYQAPVLFTLTSTDGHRLPESKAVRIFHGFGESALKWRDQLVDIQRERTLSN